jgi:hypothetical protein
VWYVDINIAAILIFPNAIDMLAGKASALQQNAMADARVPLNVNCTLHVNDSLCSCGRFTALGACHHNGCP